MRTQRSYYVRASILGVTAALASCLLALALAAPPVQATHYPIDLSISQTDSPDPVEAGQNLTYTLRAGQEVTGCGGSCNSSGGVTVTDTLPAGVSLVSATPSSGSCSGTSTITCNLGDLLDGQFETVSIVVTPTSAGTLTNTATVTNTSGYHDPNTGNDSSTVTTEVSGDPPPPPTPDTTLTATPDSFSTNVSPRFSFTSSDASATFECKRDDQAFQSCASPKQLFLLSEGQHTFQVRAKDANGNMDPTPAEYTWTVDSIDPKVTFTEKPTAVTNDRTPTWAWTVEEANPGTYKYCYLYDYTIDRSIFSQSGCASPFDFEADLPDGEYGFSVELNDKAGNYEYQSSYFEVDTAAPKIVSVKPTGRLVRPSANVVVILNDTPYKSNSFVNIYKKGSNTPLAVYRYTYEDPRTYEDLGIELSPKSYSFRRDTWYTVRVTTGVNDGANNLEAPKTWSFKTK